MSSWHCCNLICRNRDPIYPCCDSQDKNKEEMRPMESFEAFRRKGVFRIESTTPVETEFRDDSLKKDSFEQDDLSLASTVVFKMPKSAEGLASHVDSDDEDSPSNPAQYGEKNLLKVTIIDLPYNVVQILDTDVKLPDMTTKRHIFTGPGELTTLEALRMAQERDARVQKTTIFQNTSEFWLCAVNTKWGREELVISRHPIRTFHCVYEHSVWIPFFLGRFHAVFTDRGQNFPGYILKKVHFYSDPTSKVFTPSTTGATTTTGFTTATIEQNKEETVSLAGLDEFEMSQS